MKKILLSVGSLISVVAVLANCGFGPGMQDYSYDVGTGYKLVRSSSHTIQIIPIGGNDLTNPKPEISPKVVEIAWDERYILAKQVGLKRAYPWNPNNSYQVPDNSIVLYFILDTAELELYGGYDFNSFSEKRNELGISADIVLKAVKQYGK